MENFAKIVNSWKLWTIVAKFSILDFFKISQYASKNKHEFHTKKYSLILLPTHLDSCKQSLFHFPSFSCAPLLQSNLRNLLGRPWSWPGSIKNKKWSFPLRISSVNVTKSQFPANLVTFTEEILNEKLKFLCSD